MSEGHLKATHAQRHEAAQARREDKRRAEKERIMAEEDPDKQRKWEVIKLFNITILIFVIYFNNPESFMSKNSSK